MSTRFILQIEKNIKVKINQIKEGKVTMKESGIGKQFNRLKDLDEASYQKLLQDYMKVIQKK